MKTVAEVLTQARSAGVDRLDAQLLLCHVLGRSRSWLLANDDVALDATQQQHLSPLIARRASGEPLAYLVGEKEFHGLTLQVSPAVLVPRPDTETLVDWALELLRDTSHPHVLDMGTGSGAIALALKHTCPHARVSALDASDEALAVARANAERLQLDIQLLQSDWWQGVAGQRFDMIVSNPPYIAEGDAHLAALQHEPLQALTSGTNGLDAMHEIIAGARQHLNAGAWLLLEHGHDQAPAVARLLAAAGFSEITTRPDLSGTPRCTGGRRV
ncbi:MAG: peptide chain release factor N(5)-glutamine methyltransferase [Rhizobacter sp.]|nr:peptide chain release factor N(5)-glutamine methyltransferase [Rhizobacter sp.]